TEDRENAAQPGHPQQLRQVVARAEQADRATACLSPLERADEDADPGGIGEAQGAEIEDQRMMPGLALLDKQLPQLRTAVGVQLALDGDHDVLAHLLGADVEYLGVGVQSHLQGLPRRRGINRDRSVRTRRRGIAAVRVHPARPDARCMVILVVSDRMSSTMCGKGRVRRTSQSRPSVTDIASPPAVVSTVRSSGGWPFTLR